MKRNLAKILSLDLALSAAVILKKKKHSSSFTNNPKNNKKRRKTWKKKIKLEREQQFATRTNSSYCSKE